MLTLLIMPPNKNSRSQIIGDWVSQRVYPYNGIACSCVRGYCGRVVIVVGNWLWHNP